MTHNVAAEKTGGRAGVRAATVWRSAIALVRGSDVAMVYGLIVVVIAVVLAFVSGATHDHIVLQVSTNLVNLRDRCSTRRRSSVACALRGRHDRLLPVALAV